MQTKYINEMLNLPELKIHQILSIDADEFHIEAFPLIDRQCCPCCESDQDVIRKGSNESRTVRHLSVFEKKTYLHVPSIRMYCTRCKAGFVWAYEFVGPKQRYSRLFRSHTVEQALGSTAAHSARMQQAPYSVCITRRFQLSVSGSMSKFGKKRKKPQNWYWVSMTLRSKKAIRITPAFITSKARRCWTC